MGEKLEFSCLKMTTEDEEVMDERSLLELEEEILKIDMEARKKEQLLSKIRAKLNEVEELQDEQEFLELKLQKKIKELQVSIIGMMKGRVEEDVW